MQGKKGKMKKEAVTSICKVKKEKWKRPLRGSEGKVLKKRSPIVKKLNFKFNSGKYENMKLLNFKINSGNDELFILDCFDCSRKKLFTYIYIDF